MSVYPYVKTVVSLSSVHHVREEGQKEGHISIFTQGVRRVPYREHLNNTTADVRHCTVTNVLDDLRSMGQYVLHYFYANIL